MRILTYRLPSSDELYAQSIANGRLSILKIGTPTKLLFPVIHPTSEKSHLQSAYCVPFGKKGRRGAGTSASNTRPSGYFKNISQMRTHASPCTWCVVVSSALCTMTDMTASAPTVSSTSPCDMSMTSAPPTSSVFFTSFAAR